MKILLYIVGGLVALALVLLLVFTFMLGGLVKKGVNLAGPAITQTPVVLEDADISPFSGKGTLKGLTVGNPAGWTTARAFYLGEITIELDTSSLGGDRIVINRILIDRPEVTYETKITSSNLQDLLKNIQASAGASAAPAQPAADKPAAEQPGTPAPAQKPVKLEVKSFRFENAKVVIAGGGSELPLELPAIVMENLGTREGGLTPEELAMAMVKEITAQVVKVGAKKAAEKGLFEKAGKELNKLLR